MALITAEELRRRIDEPTLRVVDVRFHLADHGKGRRDYDRAHLPGAVFVDLHTELAGGPGGGRHPLPPVDDFVDLLGRLGIGPDTFVVAYDDLGGAIAARLWWMLRSIGHDHVAVLDGGIGAWQAAGGEVTGELPGIEPVPHPAVDGWSGTVDADEVARAVTEGRTVVDARAPERFRGDVEPIDPRAGHVPGAINRFHGDALAADGTHRRVDELVRWSEDLGAGPIVYCGSGVTACHALLSMEVAGIVDARLYPGSWSEWCSDPSRPVATGAV